jgi:ribosomal protein S12 methylthiotransferase accessory factor YcaO
VPTYPSVDDSRERLRQAGWSPAREGCDFPGQAPNHWVVVRREGQSVVGEGKTAREAWWRAAEQALGGEEGVP